MLSIKHLQIRPKQLLIGSIAVSFVTVLSALALFVAQSPLKQSQDDRKQAAIPEQNTIAEITIVPSTAIAVGDQSSFIISGSTGSSDTYGFQFVAMLDTTHIQDVVLTPNVQANLSFPVATVTTKSPTQSEVVIFAVSPNITAPVNISGIQTLATLSFKAKSIGTITLSPHDGDSKVLSFGGSASLDLLKPMSSAVITIGVNGCTRDLKICPDGTKVGRDPNNNCAFFPCPTPTPTPTPTPGTGGYVVQGCNGDCSSNRECDVNLVCSNNKCRLPANVDSTSCQPKSTSGSLSSCNQYCADSRECDSSMMCWYNQCRNPRNVTSVSCANPTVAEAAAVVSSCNQACASNRDCATSLLCYYGVCRAATNPKSVSCNPVPTAPAPAKGKTIATPATPSAGKSATASGAIATPTPAPTATPVAIFDTPVDQSALDTVQRYISNFWQTGSRTQVFVIFGLATLMILGLITLLFSLLVPRKPKSPPHRTPPPVMPPPTLGMPR